MGETKKKYSAEFENAIESLPKRLRKKLLKENENEPRDGNSEK